MREVASEEVILPGARIVAAGWCFFGRAWGMDKGAAEEGGGANYIAVPFPG